MPSAPLTLHVALVSELPQITPAELARVAAALSVQVARDFGPAWGVSATVDPFPSLDAVPHTHWPVVIEQNIDTPGAAGVHENESDGTPFALVAYAEDWSIVASHETLEMLADPSGNRLAPATLNGQPVKVLVEVADPPEDDQFGYEIDGVLVSDFVLPSYYTAGPGPYSFCRHVAEPLSLLTGGYMSFVDAAGHWSQLTWFDGPRPVVRSLGKLELRGRESFRAAIDRATPVARTRRAADLRGVDLGAVLRDMRANGLREQIGKLKGAAA